MASSSETSAISPAFMNNYFSDLLNSPAGDESGLLLISGSMNRGTPKFKSLHPPSLPISPSSYLAFPPGLSLSDLLDSPVLLSSANLLPSPTTGSFPAAHSYDWRNPQTVKQEDYNNNYSEFTFQPESRTDQQQPWNFNNYPSFSSDISEPQINDNIGSNNDYGNFHQPSQTLREERRSDDGYNWRKYGQKQAKGSENLRSYYKCTFISCPTKKKVERSLEGAISEIVYRGSHNHPKPQSTRRSSSNSSQPPTLVTQTTHHVREHSFGSQVSENSSFSVGDEDRSSQKSAIEDAPVAKRLKRENEGEIMSGAQGCRAVREPRVVVQTTSDIDILDDGYKWRKYGQKVVKGNPNPRNYYKCTNPGCPVRKHVERASHDLRAVITSYEGKHNHDVPAARGSSSMAATRPSSATAMINNSNSNNSSITTSTQPTSRQQQAPFTLEMVRGPRT